MSAPALQNSYQIKGQQHSPSRKTFAQWWVQKTQNSTAATSPEKRRFLLYAPNRLREITLAASDSVHTSSVRDSPRPNGLRQHKHTPGVHGLCQHALPGNRQKTSSNPSTHVRLGLHQQICASCTSRSTLRAWKSASPLKVPSRIMPTTEASWVISCSSWTRTTTASSSLGAPRSRGESHAPSLPPSSSPFGWLRHRLLRSAHALDAAPVQSDTAPLHRLSGAVGRTDKPYAAGRETPRHRLSELRQAYRVGNLRHLYRIDSRFNPSDSMSKMKANSYLAEVLRTAKLTTALLAVL